MNNRLYNFAGNILYAPTFKVRCYRNPANILRASVSNRNRGFFISKGLGLIGWCPKALGIVPSSMIDHTTQKQIPKANPRLKRASSDMSKARSARNNKDCFKVTSHSTHQLEKMVARYLGIRLSMDPTIYIFRDQLNS